MDLSRWTARPALIAASVIGLLFVVFLLRAAPLALDPVRAANAPDQFDTSRAIERLARVLGDQTPHPVDSDALDVVRERLLTEIRALGYTPDVRDQTACRTSISGSSSRCARVQNIVFETGPSSGPALVLTAHYDSVDAAPGAADDGIGVAVWLEVAHLLKQSPPNRRVVFLLTDGEETALLGAQAFIDDKTYGIEVGRFINLEARGVRGPATMFETSRPNGDIVRDWAQNGARPFSNSLMTAVYELLPNSTDLTVYLEAGLAGVNIAIGDGLSFYHTHRDDLEMLDHRSVQHMGDQAWGTTRAFLSVDSSTTGDIIYSDILNRAFYWLPQPIGLMIIGLGFGVAALMVMRPSRDADWRKLDWRAFLAPPLLLLAAGASAWAIQQVIGLFRSEPEWWAADTGPLNVAIFLLAALCAVLATGLIAGRSTREALNASGWFWTLAPAVAFAFVVPGSMGIFVPAALAFAVCAVIGWLMPRFALPMWTLALLVQLAILVPLIELFDIMMGMGIAPLFGVLAFLILSPALGLIGPLGRRFALPAALAGAGALVASVLAFLSPAYTVDTPLALNFAAAYDMDERRAVVGATAPAGALPASILQQLPEEPAPIVPGMSAPLPHAQIAFRNVPSATINLLSDATSDGKRTLRFSIDAPGARFVRVRTPAALNPQAVKYAPHGKAIPHFPPSGGVAMFDCFGRACHGAEFELTLAANQLSSDAPPILVHGYWSGVPTEAAHLPPLRPDWALPIGTGDVTITTRRVRL